MNLRYLEAVLDVVARLPDAHRLQHAGVAQLPQHQVVAEPQGQLGDAEKLLGTDGRHQTRKGKL